MTGKERLAIHWRITHRASGESHGLLPDGSRCRAARSDSTWFTSYYTGANTISPQACAEIVDPFERAIDEPGTPAAAG